MNIKQNSKMTTKLFLVFILIMDTFLSNAQNGWSICNSPSFLSRVDDLHMLNEQTGYAVCGDGKIVKTTDGGNNWILLLEENPCRSVEFINTQKGFVGGFSMDPSANNILRKTIDGGTTWSDLTSIIDTRARQGICGIAVADTNTIYGCGNWYQDTAYIIKSIDGGNTWNYIDMGNYASSLIDMYFTSKDTGFATGRGPLPSKTAVILYTTDGGLTWTYKFQDNTANEYCWKIQHLTNEVYFASIQAMTIDTAKILKSIDGGMTWTVHHVLDSYYNIQGIGFIDTLKGWTGGYTPNSFESNDGGITWDTINICPLMNRVFKVNDTLLFATGMRIWKYGPIQTGIKHEIQQPVQTASINCYPNPVNENLIISTSLNRSTHTLIILFDEHGKEINVFENTNQVKGEYKYNFKTSNLSAGVYYLVMKTHEEHIINKIFVVH
jgi:photosystem II stability/assembly factor-like uncharacterized protein